MKGNEKSIETTSELDEKENETFHVMITKGFLCLSPGFCSEKDLAGNCSPVSLEFFCEKTQHGCLRFLKGYDF